MIRLHAGKKDCKRWKNENKLSDRVKEEEIKCRECKGFRQIQRECANTLQIRKKAMIVKTFSDDESDASDDEANKSKVVTPDLQGRS